MASSSSSSTTSTRESHLRDQDLVRWIENKLGSTELWGGRQASSMLTRDMLVELETCFQELEPATKMKIIQAMAHLSPKILHAWKEPLLNLIQLARRDPDDWVEAMADLFRNFPDLGSIQCSSRPDSYFNKTLDELMRILSKTFDGETTTAQFPLPFDSALMNASAIAHTYGPESLTTNRHKHFTMRKQNTKFDKLLADAKKASELQNNPANRKVHGTITSSFPIKVRSCAKKLDNDLPMKGLSSSTSALKMSTGFTNDSKRFQQRTLLKRTGGAQLLDIAELPQLNKRRRTITAVPSSTTAVVDHQPAAAAGQRKNSLTKRPLNNKLGTAVSALPPRQQLKQLAEDNEANTAVDNGGDGISAGDNGVVAGTATVLSSLSAAADAIPPSPCLSNISEQYTSSSTPSAEFVPHQTSNHSSLQRMMTGDQRRLAGPLSSSLNTTQMMSSSNSSTSSASSCFSNLFTEICAQTAQCQPLPTIDINPENEALKQFNGLLKDANKLSPLSYNMIVSFLSGNKTNPLMDKLGTLITLPLSESVELEANDTSGTSAAAVFLVETFFQMNYCTGEWKRLRKSRLLKPEELGKYAHYLHGTKQLINNNHFGTGSSNDCGGAMLNALSTPGGTDALVPNFAGQHVVQHQQEQQQQHMVPRRQQQQQQQTFWALQQQHQQPFGNPSTSSSSS
uniref:HDAg domain-containing protein n=1 Tax=Globodera rostochiensis TaxID=31243 RepID=A0A914HM42_GLORO